MRYTLLKEDGTCGDSGGMSMAIGHNELNEVVSEHDMPPTVGMCIRVGSIYARTMQYQDWWQTSSVKEILSDIVDESTKCRTIKFRTDSGSIYDWTAG